MNALYEKCKKLKIDSSWIGLEPGEQMPYFCMPIGAEIIGWDNGIHYCFVNGLGFHVIRMGQTEKYIDLDRDLL